MHITEDYLRNLPALLDRWAADIDRLDIRDRPREDCDGDARFDPLDSELPDPSCAWSEAQADSAAGRGGTPSFHPPRNRQ